MEISVNGATVESDSAAAAIGAAIQTFCKIGDGEIVQPYLEEVRTWSLFYLNTWRGEQRIAAGLTVADFQELCYTGKALECQRWINAQETIFALAGEAAARGITNLEMADLVLGQWAAWQAASDPIEAAYISARQQVLVSESIEAIADILAQLG